MARHQNPKKRKRRARLYRVIGVCPPPSVSLACSVTTLPKRERNWTSFKNVKELSSPKKRNKPGSYKNTEILCVSARDKQTSFESAGLACAAIETAGSQGRFDYLCPATRKGSAPFSGSSSSLCVKLLTAACPRHTSPSESARPLEKEITAAGGPSLGWNVRLVFGLSPCLTSTRFSKEQLISQCRK